MLCGVSRNRLLLLAGAVGAAALVVVVLILIGAGSDSKSDNTVSSASAAAPQKKPFLAGVPQHGNTLGAADAPATLTVYEDPQCPFCRDWALGTLPSVVENYVRPGRLKLVYNGVQIIGPNSQAGLRAIYAAGRQNKLWNLADALYRRQGAENSGWITDAVISEAAAQRRRERRCDPGSGTDAGRHRAADRRGASSKRRPRPGHADLRPAAPALAAAAAERDRHSTRPRSSRRSRPPCSEPAARDRRRGARRDRGRRVPDRRPLHAHLADLHDRRLREGAALELREARRRSRRGARARRVRRHPRHGTRARGRQRRSPASCSR